MSLILLLQQRQGAPTPPDPDEPAYREIGGGGAQAINQWKQRRDKLRREIQQEEEELLAFAPLVAQQLARDHMHRQAMR